MNTMYKKTSTVHMNQISNDFNREQYAQHAADYIEGNLSGEIGGNTPAERVEFLQSFLPVGRSVFEIGSGGGEDAVQLKARGYKVTASDFVQEFVEALWKQDLTAILFDAKHDEFPEEMDALYANAVLVHFRPEEVKSLLERAKKSLQNEKIVFISVLKGEGTERSARGRGFERDFQYYTLDTLRTIIEESGFSLVQARDEDPKWLQVICQDLS